MKLDTAIITKVSLGKRINEISPPAVVRAGDEIWVNLRDLTVEIRKPKKSWWERILAALSHRRSS